MAENAPIAAIRQPDDEAAKLREEIAALKTKLEIRTIVSEEVMEQRRREFGRITPPVAPPMPPKPEGELVAMRLDRNYHPMGYYEIVGYNKEAIITKDLSGIVRVLEPACFIDGEQKPPRVAGTGYPTKIWADTVIRLPKDEAKRVKTLGIGSVELAD